MTHKQENSVALKRTRFQWADIVAPFAIFSILFVLCLWLRYQGIQSLTTVDSGLGSLGLLTGLLSSDFMLLQVLMLARIPWIERAWGHDTLARWHKYFGYTSFWLLVAHILLFVAQRLNRVGRLNGAVLWELFIHESWLLAASVGTVMIFVVVFTSVKAARRRLRYESWHLLHLYAYLGMGLALPHQILDGADFHSTFAQIYWWSFYAATLIAVLAFRVVLPLFNSLYHRVRVISVEAGVGDVATVNVEGYKLNRLRTKSGQFFIWRFLDGPGWSRANPYSISAAPTENHLRLSVKTTLGDGSNRAAKLRPGTRVLIEGPYGSMTTELRQFPKLLLVAAGIGITPMRALLEDAPYAEGETTLVYRFDTKADAIFIDEIDEIAQRRGVTLHYIVGSRRADGSWFSMDADHRKTDVQLLQEMIPDIAQHDIFVCGPPRWMKMVVKTALKAGADRKQIHLEDFAW